MRRTLGGRVVDAFRTRQRKLPPATGSYTVDKGLRVPMRDGVKLVADLYTPVGTSRGLILVRSAYGRGLLFATEYARPYAERGFTVLLQSTRGTFGSGGDKIPFHHEIEDGADTVEWMRAQPWFPGTFAMHGASYLGFNQFAIMMDPPAELTTSVVTFAPHHLGRILHESGAATVQTALQFSDGFGRQESDSLLTTMRRGASASRRHAPVFAALPLLGAEEPVLEGRAPWYREWLTHPDPDETYWHDGDFDEALQRVSVPVLIQGGWQDVFLESAFQEFEALSSRGVPVAVTIGPWTHGDIGGKASGTLGTEALDWFGAELASDLKATRLANPVRIFVTGADEWRDLAAWPPATEATTYRLGAEGTLGAGESSGSTTFTYDPSDPTPSVGGASQAKDAGVQDNSELEKRDDVLTFTTEVLTADLEVIGSPQLTLFHDTDNPHADLHVTLCDVDAAGHSFNVTERYVRLDPSKSSGAMTLTLRPLAHRFAVGHRVRVQIAGGAFPRYVRNLGTDAPQGAGTELVPSHRIIRHDAAHPSTLTLPVPK